MKRERDIVEKMHNDWVSVVVWRSASGATYHVEVVDAENGRKWKRKFVGGAMMARQRAEAWALAQLENAEYSNRTL